MAFQKHDAEKVELYKQLRQAEELSSDSNKVINEYIFRNAVRLPLS